MAPYNERMARSRAAQAHASSAALTRAAQAPRPEWEPPQGVTVGAAHDPAEHAADALASQVLSRLSLRANAGATSPSAATPRSEAQAEPAVQRAPSGGALAGQFEADPKVSDEIRGRAGKGKPLDSPMRTQLERGFGRSLSGV